MKKLIKILGIVFGGLVGLVVIAVHPSRPT